MPKVAVFAENLVYVIGGAEKSTYLLLQHLAENPDVEIIPVSGVNRIFSATAKRYPYENVVEIPGAKLRLCLPFLQYALNAGDVTRYFRDSDADLLLASTHTAPMAINAFDGPSVYFIHDEMSLHIYRTYDRRLYKRLKFAGRVAVDLPFLAHYRNENRRAMEKAKLVVANSEYIARRAKERIGVDAVVMYPQIDVEALSNLELPPVEERPLIMMVGDAVVKGFTTFHRIAEAMPDQEFLRVGKSLVDRREGNVTFRGFAPDAVEHYRKAKLLLVPSAWEEAFGMVSVEVGAMGIPTIVSDRGGLPETVPSRDYVVEDYLDPGAWVGRIRDVLRDYECHPPLFREHAAKFDLRRQAATLIEDVRKATGIQLR